MKKLDDTTLEAIAEAICGEGTGSGGGYASPCPYRSKGQIIEFFRRSNVTPQGMSSTRKWYALESLQAVNGAPEMDLILKRLVNPKEYRGEEQTTQTVREHVNRILQVEGIELVQIGIEVEIRERKASVTSPKPPEQILEHPPHFPSFVTDHSLATILTTRWNEAQRCFNAAAHLSAIIMMGSILEGVLLHKISSDFKMANQTAVSPKNKEGKVKPVQEWSLSNLIDVAHEVGWLQGDVKRFSHALREFRNLVHPHAQVVMREHPDADTCRICWQVVRAAVADLLNIDSTVS